MRNLSLLFDPPPTVWGYRGDPLLWLDIKKEFELLTLPCAREDFVLKFEEAFFKFAGIALRGDIEWTKIEKYKQKGGITNGGVLVAFWRDMALPMLIKRLEMENLSLLFDAPPHHASCRLPGDPALWIDMQKEFEQLTFPCTKEQFITAYEQFFLKLTGVSLYSDVDILKIRKYVPANMAEGVHTAFWRDTALSFLI